MTQFEYDTIVKCIQSGAPAIAGELIASLNKLLIELDKTDTLNAEETKETEETEETEEQEVKGE